MYSSNARARQEKLVGGCVKLAVLVTQEAEAGASVESRNPKQA